MTITTTYTKNRTVPAFNELFLGCTVRLVLATLVAAAATIPVGCSRGEQTAGTSPEASDRPVQEISVLSSERSGVSCYSVTDSLGALIIGETCPREGIDGDVRFEAATRWGDRDVMVLFIDPRLRVSSQLDFSRDDARGWTAFVDADLGGVHFDLYDRGLRYACSAAPNVVKCNRV